MLRHPHYAIEFKNQLPIQLQKVRNEAYNSTHLLSVPTISLEFIYRKSIKIMKGIYIQFTKCNNVATTLFTTL